MKSSEKGINLIKKYEGFASSRYLCSGNKWTIGYGHVLKDGENITEIDEQQAEFLLKNDIEWAECIVNKGIIVPLTQNQFDALVSLVYNCGAKNFLHSKGLQKLNNYDYNGAIEEFKKVNMVREKVIIGLVRRREDEAKLFIKVG